MTFRRLQVGQTKFHKSHHFDVNNDLALMVGATKPGIGGERLPFQESPANNSVIPRGNGPNLPAWVAFDKQVLSFDAYFMERVTEKAEEQYRVHQCRVLFYLEDDSMQVVERRGQNAGMPQGSRRRKPTNCTVSQCRLYLQPIKSCHRRHFR